MRTTRAVWRRIALGVWVTAAWGGSARAGEQPPRVPPLYRESVRSLEEGLPQVAVYKLRAFLESEPAGPLRDAAVRTLARALLAVSDPQAALAILDAEHPDGADEDAETSFWRGQVDAALARWPEALANHRRAAADTRGEWQAAAHFGEGEALLALDRPAEAMAAFKALIDDPRLGEPARLRCAEIALDHAHVKDASNFLLEAGPATSAGVAYPVNPYAAKEHAYLLGRLRLALGQPALAEQMFAGALADPDGLSERLLVACHWGWAQARLDLGQLDHAQDALEMLLERYPRNTYLAHPFAGLEELYLRDPAPDLSDLRRWTQAAAEPVRAAYATLTLGRVDTEAGKLDQAEEIFAGFDARFPESPLRARALYDLATVHVRLGHWTQAQVLVEGARRLLPAALPAAQHALGIQLDALDARISLAQNDNAGAARRFEEVSRRIDTGSEAEAAEFDAALGWLRAANAGRFVAVERDFKTRFPRSELNAEFLLEEGLARADQTTPADRSGRQAAAASLRKFLVEEPANQRAAEARVALAELAFERAGPNLNAAWREIDSPELRAVANAPSGTPAPAAAAAERSAYLAIWLADAPGPSRDETKAIALARTFLEKWPGSNLAPEARMKLSEIYFRREDYSNAQTELELLAQSTPNSPLAETALYLAGMAASRSMSPTGLDKAVTLLEAAARRDGAMKLPARLRQAEVQTRLGKNQDALILYDGVISATADRPLEGPDLESRCAALAGRGETLFAMATNDPKLYSDSAAAFAQLAQTPGISLRWRRQALTQQGRALEKLGDQTAALVAYDDALNAPEHAASSPEAEPEWTWYYRAGSDAATLLESQSQWSAAIAIYKKLAAADGPLKAEFETLLNRRRLEHFIWED